MNKTDLFKQSPGTVFRVLDDGYYYEDALYQGDIIRIDHYYPTLDDTILVYCTMWDSEYCFLNGDDPIHIGHKKLYIDKLVLFYPTTNNRVIM